MPGSAIGLSLGFGYAGNASYSGPGSDNVEAHPMKLTSANIPFGAPVILNTDYTVSMADATLTAANFAGVARAIVHSLLTYPVSTSNINNFYAPGSGAVDVVKRGIVSVFCKRGTPTAGGTVYVRTALHGSFPTAAIGDLEASADGANSVALTSAVWHTNRIDANLITQLKLKGINN